MDALSPDASAVSGSCSFPPSVSRLPLVLGPGSGSMELDQDHCGEVHIRRKLFYAESRGKKITSIACGRLHLSRNQNKAVLQKRAMSTCLQEGRMPVERTNRRELEGNARERADFAPAVRRLAHCFQLVWKGRGYAHPLAFRARPPRAFLPSRSQS